MSAGNSKRAFEADLRFGDTVLRRQERDLASDAMDVGLDRLVEVRPAWPDFAAAQQSAADETMSDHDRNGVALLARQRKELRRETRDHLLIEGHGVYGLAVRNQNSAKGSSGGSPSISARP